ncbi:MAG: hypothetical protein AB4050_13190 [Synechococcus sp.]
MSAVVGHSLLEVAIYTCSSLKHRIPSGSLSYCILAGLWLACLVMAAVAPDLDYIVPWLDKGHYGGLRIFHSLLFSLWIPGTLALALWVGSRGKSFIMMMVTQAVMAVFSHLILDLLVGVRPVPTLWRLSQLVTSIQH